MTSGNGYKISTEKRLATLETKVEEVITNHLPHIQDKVDRIQWLVITSLVALVLNLVYHFIK